MGEDERNQKIKSCEQWRERLFRQGETQQGQKNSQERKRDSAKQRDSKRLRKSSESIEYARVVQFDTHAFVTFQPSFTQQ